MRTIYRWMSILVLLFFAVSYLSAQQQTPLPAIISFTSDVESIALTDAEAGIITTTLTWHTAGMSDAHTLRLYQYRLAQWIAVNDDPLPEMGTMSLDVEHTLTFSPPTYRLVIETATGRMIDERVLVIPYQIPDGDAAPEIEVFQADVAWVDIDELVLGTAHVEVTWRIANRPLTANLSFVQVVGEDQVMPVELPRPNLWVSSAGQGPVAPLRVTGGGELHLRLRLVDMVDGFVYDEQDLTLPIVGELSEQPQPQPPAAVNITPPPTPGTQPSQAQIVSLSVFPAEVDRGGRVTISWDVRNATQRTIWRLNPIGQIAEWLEDIPAAGSWTVTLPDYYVDQVTFQIWAADAQDNRVMDSVTARVHCPYTYFFGLAQDSCPAGEAQQITAAVQRFERGFMVWRGDQRRIYVLYDGGTLERYDDTWQEGEIIEIDAPPSGLVQPVRGFGKVWATYAAVRDRLGWATSEEAAYTMQAQMSGAYRYANTYFTLPDGRIVAIVENSWRFVSA